MITDTIKDFKNKTLSEKTLVKELLTDLGGGPYCYLLMLENSKRNAEAELIKTLRTKIFALRDAISITYREIAAELQIVKDLLNVHLTIIETVPERKWETWMFTNYKNDLSGAIFFFNDNAGG